MYNHAKLCLEGTIEVIFYFKKLVYFDIKEILYHAMPNTWEKKIVEQGYNYLDGPVHSMAEFFETRIEILQKSIPPSVPSKNKKTKRKALIRQAKQKKRQAV